MFARHHIVHSMWILYPIPLHLSVLSFRLWSLWGRDGLLFDACTVPSTMRPSSRFAPRHYCNNKSTWLILHTFLGIIWYWPHSETGLWATWTTGQIQTLCLYPQTLAFLLKVSPKISASANCDRDFSNVVICPQGDRLRPPIHLIYISKQLSDGTVFGH